MGALLGDETSEPAAAGDEDEAAGGAGQQRPYLPGVAGVVQHDQDAPVGEDAAVEGGPRVEPLRDGLRGHAERHEEHLGHGVRKHRGAVRVVAAQIDVEAAVGEPVGDPVGPVHGEGGLAGPRHAVDDADDRGPGRSVSLGQQGRQVVEFGPPAGEQGQIRGELSGTRGADPAAGRGGVRLRTGHGGGAVRGSGLGGGVVTGRYRRPHPGERGVFPQNPRVYGA